MTEDIDVPWHLMTVRSSSLSLFLSVYVFRLLSRDVCVALVGRHARLVAHELGGAVVLVVLLGAILVAVGQTELFRHDRLDYLYDYVGRILLLIR